MCVCVGGGHTLLMQYGHGDVRQCRCIGQWVSAYSVASFLTFLSGSVKVGTCAYGANCQSDSRLMSWKTSEGNRYLPNFKG
jgi:hypothetical protein